MGGGQLLALFAALLLVASTLFAVPAYAAEGSAAAEPSLWDNIVRFFTGEPADEDAGIELYAAGDKSPVVDQATLNNWSDYASASTENIGRIWTDKSVFTDDTTLTGSTEAGIKVEKTDGADFMVSLSALSSASSSVTYSSKPLDIVLVLDTSGSMEDAPHMGTTETYNRIYSGSVRETDAYEGWFGWNQTDGGTYYALVGDEYVQIQEETRVVHSEDSWFGTTNYYDHVSWQLNGQEVWPKENANDNTENHVQFYTHRTENITKIDALKDAATAFIEQTAKMNEGIESRDNMHRISIVSYSGEAYTRDGLTVVDQQGASDLTDTIDGLSAGGATAADYAFADTQDVLRNARSNAQKVVIFFTDGEPNHQSGFDPDVAAATINTAYDIKANNTIVYTVGVFQGAAPGDDPTDRDTANFNKFMHAVSSNYPQATAENWRGNASWGDLDFGDRAQDSNYYKAATNADELNNIFSEIAEDMASAAANSPTQVDEGADPNQSGYITFTDTLGDYMEVKGFNSIVFANSSNTTVHRTTSGNTDTYTFDGTFPGNNVYPEAELSNIRITVAHGSGSAGDTVTVQIPASIIPLRYFDVNTASDGTSTMDVTPAYPLRVFYSVGLREGVDLANPDETLQTYINNNSADGTVSFYSNDFTKGAALGNTTASFEPAEGNSFYYFPVATPLYVQNGDGAFVRATGQYNSNTQYYYLNNFYSTDGSTVTAHPDNYVTVSNGTLAGHTYNTSWGEGNYLMVRAHTPKLDRIADINESKGGNETGTASTAISPDWGNNDIINVSLGNNGRLAVELPGTLAVTKNVTAEEGFTAPANDAEGNPISFEFQFDITSLPEGVEQDARYDAQVFNADGTTAGDAFTIASGEKHSITARQTMKIYGLSAGTQYSVTETGIPAGFIQTEPANNGAQSGTIASNQTATASFTNTYSADPFTLRGDTYLKVSKEFTDRDWHDGESFTFEIVQSQDNPSQVTLPTNVTLGYNDQSEGKASGSFGDIQLTRAGTYVFYIHEVTPANADQIPGVNYSAAWYRVTIPVYDNADGKLIADEPNITMVQVRDDAGQTVNNDVENATFVNRYKANEGTADIEGVKVYENESGANELTDGKFTFEIEALGGYVTADGAPEGDEGYDIDAADVPMPQNQEGETVTEVGNVGEHFAFPTITFGPNTVDNTYVYRVTEKDSGEAGMIYSDEGFIVTVAVSDDEEDAEGNAIIVAKVTLPEGGVSFTNTFNPDDATLSGDDALGGTKVIDGRGFKADETFGFTLGWPEATQTAIDNGWIEVPVDTIAEASAATNGAFSFGDITFTRAGTYEFTINETAHNVESLPGDNTEGMTYDRHTCTVQVTVELGAGDNANKLVVTDVDYGTYNQKDGNQFTNTYEANMDYGEAAGGLVVGKTLTGRAMTVGEFDFTITGVDSDIEGAVSADVANQWLGEDDKSFSNDNNVASGEEDTMNKLGLMKFTQDQAGQVFVYEVRETVPDEGSADRLGGVTYDETVWTVAIKVVDDLDGTMHTETTVSNGTDSKTYNSDNFATEGAPKVTFANTYSAAPTTEDASGSFTGTKTFTGRDMTQDETFDYTLTGADQFTSDALDNGDVTIASTNESVSNLEDGVAGSFSFGNATFEAAGTYVFNVTEAIPGDATNANVGDGQTTYADASVEDKAKTGWEYEGIAFDSHVGTVTIVVEDNLEGQLVVTSRSATHMSFSNVYTADPATFGIAGHWNFAKVIDGRDWLDTDSFTFQITAAPGTPLPDGGSDLQTGYGKVITIATPEMGAADGDEVSFDFGSIEFDFNDMIGMSERYFSYTVTEQPSTIAGITTSGATYDMVVTVRDNGDGKLEIESWTLTQTENDKGETLDNPIQLGEGETAVFTNTYSADTDDVQFAGAKSYVDYSRPQGTDQLETGMFSFKLEALGGYATDGGSADRLTIAAADTPMPANTAQGAITVTEKNAQGAWTFQNITFTQDNDGNTYLYKITEIIPDDAVNQNVNGGQTRYADASDDEKATAGWKLNGMTYDSSTYVASVAVSTTTDEQAHTAQIVATPSYTKDGQGYTVTPETPLAFANSYDPEDAVLTGDTAIKGTKTMDGRNIKQGETFTFELTPADELTQAAVNAKVITIADDNWRATTAAGDGSKKTADFTFGDITINNVGVAEGDGTYTFNVREILPVSSQNPYRGVTYDTHVAKVTVTVSDPETAGVGSGKLTAKVTYNNDTEGVVTDADAAETTKAAFTNKYKADPTTVEGEADVSFDLTKQFTGRAGNDWLTTDSFTFELLEWGKGTFNDEELTFYPDDPAQAAPMPEGTAEGSKTVQVTIDRTDRTDVANGIAPIEFAPITFTEAGDYNYTVYEVVPSDGDKIPGVVYDESRVISIVVRVTDDGNGQLHAEVLKPQDEEFDSANGISFYNYYAAQYNYGAEGTLDITKTLENRAMTDGQFSFTITATGDNAQAAAEKLGIQDGTSVEVTAPVANAGVAASVNDNPFDNLTFTSEERGTTYTYTVDENGESNDNYTYDDEVYTVALTVLDDNSGTLKVQTVVTNAAGEEVANSTSSANEVNKVTLPFVNTYQASDDTKKVEADINGATTEVNGKVVGVGDTLTYTIHWVNDAMDENGVPQAATVTVTDELPTGIEPAEIQNGGVYDNATHTITWELGEQAADAQGDVTFTATVTEDAVTVDGMTNDATIEVGDDEPKTTNEVTVDVPEKSVEEAGDHIDGEIQVGDRLTYTIEYANNTDATSDVTVVDQVPTGITVDQSTLGGGTFDEDSNTITWVIQSVAAGDRGTVSFTGVVNQSAVHEGTTLDNKASIKVGENGSEFWTNTEPVTVGSGELTISKEITLTADQGTEIDENKEFTFTVNLKDVAGSALNDTYSVTYQRAAGAEDGALAFDADGNATVTLKHNESVTIKGLPDGATYTATEADTAGYTPDEASKTGTIPAGDDNASVEFTNTYTADKYEGVPVGFELTKTFTKHEWTADYSFQFKLAGVDEDGNPAPLPKADEDAGVTVDGDAAYKTVAGPQESGSATFDFGEIEYAKAGVYTYTVTEVEPDHESDEYNPGIDYSNNEATITVTVTDRDQSGASTGVLSASASVEKGLFTNQYQTGFITVDAVCGLDVVKNMTGHAIGAGDFTFMMKGADDESTARMNDGNPVEFATAGAALGTGADTNTATETVEPKTGMMFGIEDVGHTYTYNVYEVIPEGAADNDDGTWTLNGVTYDGTQHTVAYDVTENGRGGLLVEVFVDGESCGYVTGSIATLSLTEQPTITFNNSYDAGDITVGGEDGVEFVGGKELANRPLEDGEFTFDVYDANNARVTSGTNAADGTITFGGIVYDMAKLNADRASGAATATTNDDGSTVFEYIYNIVEDQSDFEMDGISTTTPSINVTVQVTDDCKGNLTAQVVTPVEEIQFKNIYGNGEGGTYKSNLTGSKLYVDNGLENAPNIEGLYTFTVTVPEGAPEPEFMSANNDADGNVDFGVIEFTMDNVFTEADAYDEDGTRTKTFEYVVTESGNVEGVDNDSMDIRTITYTVTDMGDGRLDVQKTPAPDAREGKDFTFTNTYDVDSEDSSLTGDGGFSITKTLNSNTSRALSDDEFSFTLTDVATKEVVATATNAADGTVSFPAITFNEPGTYNYRLEEVKGDAPGVTYDTDWYGVTAFVEDNGNGTLGVEWVIEGVEPGASVVFENTYEADPSSITFGALKTLAGRDMVEGEFTFELTDPEGNAVTATNTATGSVVFPTVEFTEEGTYEYTVSEVLPADDDAATEGIQKDGVTYDEKVWTATVTVADNPETGVLEATVDYGNGTKLAEFNNTYTKPAEPPAPKPEEPKQEVIPATGDATAAAVMATAGIGAALAAAGYVTSKKRGE